MTAMALKFGIDRKHGPPGTRQQMEKGLGEECGGTGNHWKPLENTPWRKHAHAGGPAMVWYMSFILLSTRVEERQTNTTQPPPVHTVGCGPGGACLGGMLGWGGRPLFTPEAILDATTGRSLFTETSGFDKTKMLWDVHSTPT